MNCSSCLRLGPKNLRYHCQGEVILGDICHRDHHEGCPEGKDCVDDRAAAVARGIVKQYGRKDQPKRNEEGEQDLHNAAEEIGGEDEYIAIASIHLEDLTQTWPCYSVVVNTPGPLRTSGSRNCVYQISASI